MFEDEEIEFKVSLFSEIGEWLQAVEHVVLAAVQGAGDAIGETAFHIAHVGAYGALTLGYHEAYAVLFVLGIIGLVLYHDA